MITPTAYSYAGGFPETTLGHRQHDVRLAAARIAGKRDKHSAH